MANPEVQAVDRLLHSGAALLAVALCAFDVVLFRGHGCTTHGIPESIVFWGSVAYALLEPIAPRPGWHRLVTLLCWAAGVVAWGAVLLAWPNRAFDVTGQLIGLASLALPGVVGATLELLILRRRDADRLWIPGHAAVSTLAIYAAVFVIPSWLFAYDSVLRRLAFGALFAVCSVLLVRLRRPA